MFGRRAHSHLGYVTRETYETFYTQAFENVLSYLQGVPLRELVACSLETTRGRPARCVAMSVNKALISIKKVWRDGSGWRKERGDLVAAW